MAQRLVLLCQYMKTDLDSSQKLRRPFTIAASEVLRRTSGEGLLTLNTGPPNKQYRLWDQAE